MERLVAVATLVLALALPVSASATDRFASPADIGGGDCLSEATSCDLPTAVSAAGAGDDIFVRGDLGDYALSAQLTNAAAIHVHGTHGRPRLIFSSERFTLNPGSSAENLYAEFGGSFGDFQFSGSTGDNLIVQDTGHDHAIFMEDSTLTNSVAWSAVSSGTGEQPIELDKSNTLRNVTAYAPTAGGVAIVAIGRNPPTTGGTATDNFVNVIARGGPGGGGIRLFQDNGVDLTVNVDHSNYSAADIDPDSDDVANKVHLNLDASNQIAPPQFADAGNGDFHQTSCSPTIDRGANSIANGSLDFDGDIRNLGGATDIGADEFMPASCSGAGSTPPPPVSCPYGNPNCESTCTNAATLLVTCADLTASAGFCRAGDGLTAFGGQMPPQCLHPVTPRTQCRVERGKNTVCYQTTPGERPNAGSCASMGQTLPECNVPTREVPLGCQGNHFGDSVCSVANQSIPATYCPPPSGTTVPACNFPTTVTPPSKPKGATAAARHGTRLTVTIGCPKVLAKPRCKGTIAVDGLRTSMLRTLAKQAKYSASTYRLFVPGLAGFAPPFEKSAAAIAKRLLGGTNLPKTVNTAAVIAELGRSDPQTKSFAASVQRAVNEYRKLAGKAKKKRKRSKPADASRGTTTLKRFSLKSGRKRARIRVLLSAAALRRLRRDAGNRGRAPIRVIVSYKASARPVVRFADLALRVR